MKRLIGVWGLLAICCAACGDDPSGEPSTPVTPGDGMTDTQDPSAVPPVPEPKPATTTPLPRSTPEAEGVSPQGVIDLVTALQALDEVHSVMLVRHGKVIAEGWWAPYTPGDMHNMYSVTKSFNSTAVGLAVGEGLLTVDDLVSSFFPEMMPPAPAPAFQTMTVKHLLTMASGHATDPLDSMRMAPGGQWTKAFLESTPEREPGTSFLYNSGAAYVLGAIVQKVTGGTVEEYLTPRLFEPLGISNRLWGMSPEGVNLTEGGLAITTEELAKFGLFYLQKGNWNGQQIVSEQWATDATSKQISTGADNGNWNFGYGYQFWRSTVGYRADGSLGQFSFVLPDQDIVLAITAATNNNGGTNQVMNVVFQQLFGTDMIGTDPLPEDKATRDALTAKLAGLTLPTPQGAATSPLAGDVSGSRYAVTQNSQGITSLELDFSGELPVLNIEDADGPHVIPVGIGEWRRARTGFKKHINELFDTPDQAVSALGAWTSDNTFVAKLAFTETPYIMEATFAFNADQVTMDVTYNERWGNATEPQVTGAR
ncbi:MAG TPA: serine hydrolase domain-containing protein [Polyangiaceae bacterium]|nr:serine hydrolase domain-containing protein [Polyangiaceae bacterium]